MVAETAVKPEAAKAEGEEQVGPGAGQTPAPEPTLPQPTAEELQGQLVAVKKELADTKAGLSGKDRENARLRQRIDNLEGLQERIEAAIDQKFLALGEVMWGGQEVEPAEPPSQLQMLRQRLAPKPKAPPAPGPAGTPTAPEPNYWDGQLDAALEPVMGDKQTLPPNLLPLLSEAKTLWNSGDAKEAIAEVKRVVGEYQKTQAEATRAEREKKARRMGELSGSSQGSGTQTFTRAQIAAMSPAEYQKHQTSIEAALRAGKIKE